MSWASRTSAGARAPSRRCRPCPDGRARRATPRDGAARGLARAPMRSFVLKFEENLAACFMGALLFVLFLQVFTRYVLNDPLSWTEEAARYIYVYIVFLGASAAISDRTHVGIDYFAKALPVRAQWALSAGVNLLVLSALALLAYWGWRAAMRQWNMPMVVLDIPYTWVYLVVPVTAVLMSVRTIALMGEDWRAMRAGTQVATDARGGL
ncbi:MAG: TRAP transporter small permease [Alphaproteobacteria bacterium]|nr:TRAP transporter small permease [Alphaproteobacteria bacterium]MBM3628707.1 TRAP transporter small permease [Alphaproteobacteria bacterium]